MRWHSFTMFPFVIPCYYITTTKTATIGFSPTVRGSRPSSPFFPSAGFWLEKYVIGYF